MSVPAQLHRHLRVLPQWRFSPPRIQARRKLQRFGSDYGGYYLDASVIESSSVVYSLGVGEDISFDLAVIARFGTVVHAFDPTPRVEQWLAAQEVPAQFVHHAVGVGSCDGPVMFHLPRRKEWISHSVCEAKEYSDASVLLPMNRLTTVMRALGHRSIDVLKMDIEGAEYAVIEEITAQKIKVTQLVVEFHHRLSNVGIGETRKALARLESEGMRICQVCPRGEVFTLIRLQ